MQQHCQLHRETEFMGVVHVFQRQAQDAVDKSQPSERAVTAMEGKISKQYRIHLLIFLFSCGKNAFSFLFSLKQINNI